MMRRRDALRSAAALAANATLLPLRSAAAQAEADTAILEAAVAVEQLAVVVYETIAARGILSTEPRRLVRRLHDHEREHARALRRELEARGGTAPEALSPAGVPGLEALERERPALRFAIELEIAGLAAYYDAHQRLEDPELLRIVGSVMAAEGQHLAVLRQAVGDDPVPHAFETGER